MEISGEMNGNAYLENLDKLLRENGESEKDIRAAKKYASNLLELNLPVIFDINHFAALIGTTPSVISTMMATIEKNFYTEKRIPKKSGGYRVLMVPAMRLKIIQRWILDNILYNIPVSDQAMGFLINRSIVTNAYYHVRQDCVINMDLKDFFPSICQEQVFRIFYYYGYTISVSYMLSRLCTVGGKLPQGAPTSPYLSNIVCLKLDKRLLLLAKSYEAKYTRYADDLTFSGGYGIQGIIVGANSIINDEGFSVNEKKTRISYKYQRQEVTGLIVNNKVTVDRKYKKSLLQEIYYCKKYGPSSHLNHINCSKRFYKEHLYGKAYFVNMVDKEFGEKVLLQLSGIDWEK